MVGFGWSEFLIFLLSEYAGNRVSGNLDFKIFQVTMPPGIGVWSHLPFTSHSRPT
jgi:hypothetical protein